MKIHDILEQQKNVDYKIIKNKVVIFGLLIK